MTASKGALLIAAAVGLAAPERAAAQVLTWENDRAAVGVSVGRASSDTVETARGPMWTATFEQPMLPTWRLRADVGRVHFHLQHELNDSRYPQRTDLTRLSATLVRTTPYAGSLPVSMFAGGGFGLYHLSNVTQGNSFQSGAHGLAGMEVMIRQRAKIVGEVRLDLLGGSHNNNISLYALQGSAVLGVRWILGRQSSAISTRAGSNRDARRAGIHAAARPTATRTTDAATNVAGS